MGRRSPARLGSQVDRWIGDLASRQLGLVTRAQLLALGVGPGAIAHRVRSRRLRIVHRGVYLVGHVAMAELARELAAVLAVGEAALLSHASAAAVWGLIAAPRQPGDLEVTMVGGWSACRPGIVVHRTVRLDRRDRRLHGPLPLTSPARTLVDLAPSVTRDRLEQAIAQAGRRRLAREDEILAAAARAGRRRGSVVLEQLLGAGATAYTRSAAERRLLSLIREAGLPPPRVNSRLAGLEVDFVWPRRKLVVEVDGYGYHSDRLAFENDRRRDAKLVALGYRIMRITWRQLCDEPVGVVARLATALASTAGQGAT